MELPDWLRGIVLLGRDGAEYRVVGVDEDGYLGVILQAAAEVTIPGDVNVTQEDSIREMQGADGVTLRTVTVDANGQIIMVPRGNTGNYMDVDAAGRLSATMKGIEGGMIRTVQVDGDGNLISVIKGLEGATLRNVAVDANGQIIMVPRGNTGNYMDVNASGFLTAMIRGYESGVGYHWISVDDLGQMIMVPRGASGNYLGVDSDGYMTTVMKGTYGATLKTLAADDEGYLVAILKDNSDQWGEKISVGLAELAARLGSPMSWDRRGQIVKAITFENGFGDCWGSTSGAGASVELSPYYHHAGGYSCRLVSGTTVGKLAQIRTYGEFAPADRVGLEVRFSVATQSDYIYFDNRVWDGSRVHLIYARINNATDKLQIMTTAAAWVDVCAFQRPDVPSLSYRVKIVADLSTEHWVRVLTRGVEYDVSAVATNSADSDANAYVETTVAAVEDGVVSHTIYVDSVIVTTNEP